GPKFITPANVEVPVGKPAKPQAAGVPAALPVAPGAKLPPIPPPPGPLPVSQPFEAPAPIAFQEPTETLTVPPNPVAAPAPPPTPVEGPAPAPKPPEKKDPPPPKKRRILGTLAQDDEIKLNAAQNAARLRDWNRAAALLAEVIAKYPNEYDLKAELAGWLIAA